MGRDGVLALSDSNLEAKMGTQMQQAGLPKPITQYPFKVRGRGYKPRIVTYHFDCAWPLHVPPVALEIEGGTHVNGRHVRASGYESDCRKYSLAAIAGWRVIRVTSNMITSGEALTLIEKALKQETPA